MTLNEIVPAVRYDIETEVIRKVIAYIREKLHINADVAFDKYVIG